MGNTADWDSLTLMGEGGCPLLGMFCLQDLLLPPPPLPPGPGPGTGLAGREGWNWSGESREILLAASAR